MTDHSDEGLGLQRLERLPTALGVAVGVIASALNALEVVKWIFGVAGDPADPIHRLTSFLWTTLGTLVTLLVASAWYHHRLGIRVQELRVREAAIRLMHRMAEAVRSCAAAPETYRWTDFERTCSDIQKFLALRFPGIDVSVTVKQIKGARIIAVFRDHRQEGTQRRTGDNLPLHDSHVYTSFRDYPRDQKRHVYVRDTENVPSKKYSERAKACGFRSVVAFPLREPPVTLSGQGGVSGIDVANLRGFWSLDSQTPDAFIDLFRADRMRQHRDNDGKGLDPRADIQAFYGIADCIATILMLKEAAADAASEGEHDQTA